MPLPILPIVMGLAQFAPTILRYFCAGETSAAVAESVVDIAKTVTGTKTPEEALEAIRANNQLAMEFQKQILSSDTELEKAYLLDRQDARSRDLGYIQSGKHNYRGDILAFVAIIALVCLIFLLFFKAVDLPDSVRDLLLILSGSLVAIVKDVYAFEFGSTRDSKVKSDTIEKLANR